MILYGKRAKRIQEYNAVICPACGERELRFEDWKYYFHIWFIPFFPLDTVTKCHCYHCGVGNELGNEYHPEVGRLVAMHQPAKTPIYMYSFVGVLMGFVLLMVWKAQQPEKIRIINTTDEILGKGEWKNDKQEGPWTYYDDDGNKTNDYNFKNGYFHGKQTDYFPSGKVKRIWNANRGLMSGEIQTFNVEGELILNYNYEDGWLHGAYKKFSDEGILIAETWYAYGIEQGLSKAYNYDGSLYSLTKYVDGEVDSIKTFWDEEGNLVRRERFEMGQRVEVLEIFGPGGRKLVDKGNGEFISYHLNGQPEMITHYRNGKPHGEWKEYFDNGSLKASGHFSEDLKRLVMVQFDTEGKQVVKEGNGEIEEMIEGYRTWTGTFKAGKADGVWKYYYWEGGQSNSVPYVAGRLEGEEMIYYENGKLSEKTEFKDDKMHGMWTSYFDTGEKEVEGHYVNGIRHGTFIFFDSDVPVLKETYEMGVRTSKEWLVD